MDDLDRLLAQQAQAQKPQVDQLDALLASRAVAKPTSQAAITKPAQAQEEDRGVLSPLIDASNAFGHHFMGGLHGAAQLIEHGINAGANKYLPDANAEETPTFGGSLRRIINDTVASDDEAMRQREAEYQAKTPDGPAATIGAGFGMFASGGRTLPATSGLVESMGTKLASQLPNWTAKVITPASKIAGAGAAGAVAGAMSPVTSGSYWDAKEDQVKSGAALGAALKMLAPAAAKIGTNVADRFGWIPKDAAVDVNKVVENTGLPPNIVSKPKVVPQGQGTFKVVFPESDVSALNNRGTATAKDWEISGMTGRASPTAAQQTRDAGLWTTEQNMSKANPSGSINQKYIAQNDAIQQQLKNIKEGTGGTANSQMQASENVIDATLKKRDQLDDAVGNLYETLKGKPEGKKPVAFNELINQISENADSSGAENLIKTLVRTLHKKYGLLDPKSINYDQTLGWSFAPKEGSTLNLVQAEELRKLIRSSASNSTEKTIASKLINSLDNDVQESTGSDFFKTARDAASKNFAEFKPNVENQGYQSQVIPKIVSGKIDSKNLLANTILTGKPADVLAIKKTLLSGTPEQIERGTAAWNDLRGQLVDHFISKAVDPVTGKFSPRKYYNELDKIKDTGGHIFTQQELSGLGAIGRAGNDAFTDVAFSAPNYSNSGPYIENLLKQSGGSKAMGMAGSLLGHVPVVGSVGEKIAEKAAQAGQKGIEENLANYNPAVMARMTKNAEVQKALQVLPMSEHVTNMLIRNRQQKDSKAQ